MRGALVSLDTPGRVPRSAIAWLVAGGAAVALVVAVVALYAPRQMDPAPVTATIHATATFVIAAITAMLVLAHAGSVRRRGYLVLGCTYAALAALMLAVPFVFPAGLGPAEPLLGGLQSSVSIFYLWHFVLVVGVGAGAVLIDADRTSHRRASPRSHVAVSLLVTAVVVGPLIWLALRPAPPWPALLHPDGAITSFARLLDAVLLVAACVCFLLVAYGARHRSYIGVWLSVLAFLLVADAVVNLRNPGRYTLGWYFNRGLGLLVISALLVALVLHLSHIDRTNTRLAATDLLTGIGSRSELTSALEREMARALATGERIALLWVDLDGFKAVNDALGHPVGDEVLKVVAGRLRSSVRAGDMVARLGGDEFGILLCDDPDDRRAEAVADRVLSALRRPVDLEGTTALLSGSVGVAVAPEDATTPEELLHRADQAMYAAKKPGGDRRSRYVTGMGADASRRAELRRELARALRHRELDLDYQPIVDPVTAEVRGVEALVRWVRDQRRVPAGMFIGLAEATGQIQAIGLQVVEMLAHDVPLLSDALPEGSFVAFNLSGAELADAHVVGALLEGALRAHAADLVVEVTEGVEIMTGGEAERRLGELRDTGLRIAIDDFGSGFSNFGRLAQLAPALLKVDRSIVAQAAGGLVSDVAFLSAAVAVAEAVGCEVVAEGVETDAEAAVVTRFGIPLAQGFRWARPMPMYEVVELCHRGAILAS